MLAALERGVEGGKWYSLIDKVVRPSTLLAAWRKVEANRGAAGVDEVSVSQFRSGEEQYLKELERDLREGRYQPEAVRRVHIPKAPGKTRPLGIPTVKDRIVQAAVKIVLEPIYEWEFLPMSYGFRPGRGCKDALREVDGLLKEGNTWVVDADLKSYFDTIPQDRLMERVREKVSDGKVLTLLEAFLQQEIMEGMNCWKPTSGTPQGAVISPLLANIYLHPLDKRMAELGYRMVRYADDFVILCRSEEESRRALVEVREWTETNGLQLHPDKTHVGNCLEKGQGFEFLGYRFEAGIRTVRKKSLAALREKIRPRTRRTQGEGIRRVIEKLNPTLKGWFEYFKHAHRTTFAGVDGFTRRRMRAMLRKQEKRPGFGLCPADSRRWPNAFFTAKGLFTMHDAHRRICQSR
ncbi:MAG: group II intron reverse transcriptase/maturase [Magnetococcales bacterium]|nr:group II intron reverse transcriptase/maturase [Magnetococcales bacterium]